MSKQSVDPAREPGLTIEQILLVSAHFSHREDFLGLSLDTKLGEVPIEVGTKVIQKPDGTAAGILLSARTTEARMGAEQSLYRFQVEMLALIGATPGQANIPPLEFVAGSGVATLFPFLREAVANLTMRGRFGPLWLKPINVRLAIAGLNPDPKNHAKAHRQ